MTARQQRQQRRDNSINNEIESESSEEEMIESNSNSEMQYSLLLNGQYFKVKKCTEKDQMIATCITGEYQNVGKL